VALKTDLIEIESFNLEGYVSRVIYWQFFSRKSTDLTEKYKFVYIYLL